MSYLESSKGLSPSFRQSGGPGIPQMRAQSHGGGRQKCVGIKGPSLYLPGQWHLQISLKGILVGSYPQSGGLEGLTHVAEELPDF